MAGGGRRDDYGEVDIRVFTADGPQATYTVELSVGGGVESGRLAWPVDQQALLAIADPDAYGRALGASLFGEGVLGAAYAEAVAAIRGSDRGLRVRLRLDPPELQSIRWERMFQPIARSWKPIAVAGATPFSRYLSPKQWDRPMPITERPIRVLAVVAAPDGLADAGLDPIAPAEVQALHQLFGASSELQATYLESGSATPATMTQIRSALPDGFHVVHFLCHGTVAPNGSVLYLESDGGGVEPVTTDRLVEAFGALAKPPLLGFLGACESAARGKTDAFVPLGPALVQDGGLQAVVAMSDRVGQETARMFAEQFYARLLSHGMVDLAANEARALVRDQWDWGVPVLFTRLEDNQLIDFPVGRIYDEYLTHTDRAFAAATEALGAVERSAAGSPAGGGMDQAVALVHQLNDLVAELSKSHKVLVGFASSFRDVPSTPEAFPAAFQAFYLDFKRHYDAEDWTHEDTSCSQISLLSAQLLPRLSGLLDAAMLQQLGQELSILGDSDADLLRFFREYLNTMDETVERIKGLLDDGKVDEAIAAKREFEAQISPSFRRSKDMLSRMSGSLGAVSAA